LKLPKAYAARPFNLIDFIFIFRGVRRCASCAKRPL
jgi:hypothetical protein